MATEANQFVWYELMTTDAEAATAFYQAVIGWDAQDSGMPDMRYTILNAGHAPVAGLMALPGPLLDVGVHPHWIGYIAVDDVDAAAARLEEAGGRLHREADDIPDVGRFAMVADPQGAPFVLFKSARSSPPPPAGFTPGRVGWHELHAAEWQAAFEFYAGQFGWTKGEAVDMGAMGLYQTFAAGTGSMGGMMTKVEAMPAPAWVYYFNVDSIEPAVARVKAAGGQVLQGPHQVPGGSWIAQCLDPQGAMFAMVSPPS